MNCIAILLFVVAGVAATNDHPNWNDLNQALNTEYRVWVTTRSYQLDTYGQTHSCVYAKKTSMYGSRFYFDQYYDYGTQRVKHSLYGELSMQSTGPVLTVSKNEGEPGTAYTLKFWNPEKRCGILTFTDKAGETQCELHVSEQTLQESSDPNPCEKDYERVCDGFRNYHPYKPRCLTHAPGN
uniref:Lipocalin-2 1 n=1 Tax=Amblyomma americanum TaxID=6943 RepID=A0A0C9SFB5_AMBAM